MTAAPVLVPDSYFTQSGSYWDWVKSSFIQATIQNVSAEKYANLFYLLHRPTNGSGFSSG